MSTAAIEIRNLRKTYRTGLSGLRTVEALRGVNLTVQAGEIYGFLGPNGAGKSTTIKVLTQLVGASEGSALVFGEPLTSPRARQRIGYLPENPVFYDYLTGQEFLVYYGRLAGLSKRDARVRAGELLERVGMGKAGALQLRRYSKGMIQRIGIAQAVLHKPDLVILDEPVSGLDPIGRREMRDLMLELKAEGKTVFFSTHIIQDVELICDRVGIIVAGQVRREGRVSDLIGRGDEATEIMVGSIGLEQAREVFSPFPVREMGSGLSVRVPPEQVERIVRTALDRGAALISVQNQRKPLEDLFIEEIAAQAPDSAPRANVHMGKAG